MNTSRVNMQISSTAEQPVYPELTLMREVLPLQGASLLELGCGSADKLRQLADTGELTWVVGAEVDAQAHSKNLATPASGIEFARFGAEAIPHADNTFDIVMLLKSLHHVPAVSMDQAFAEIYRVLKPGGVAYVSEPVFAGRLNEVIRMFHDEQHVRELAFQATRRAVDSGQFSLLGQQFFLTPVKLQSFAQFKAGIIDATHTDHQVDATLLEQVHRKFESMADQVDQSFYFETPNRLDLLQVNKTT
ncbi:MAG: class I SAM-dependent methyltransferase [Pseudomonadota bacterium]